MQATCSPAREARCGQRTVQARELYEMFRKEFGLEVRSNDRWALTPPMTEAGHREALRCPPQIDLYICNFSMRQVIENIKSANQALFVGARLLGWREEQMVVIDSDQGESGASDAWRESPSSLSQ